MKWTETSTGFHQTNCDRGYVRPCALGFTPMYREWPEGPLHPILTPKGLWSYRKTVKAAREAVEEVLGHLDRIRGAA